MATYQEKAVSLVFEYITPKLEKTDPDARLHVYVVWFAFVLGNWKALLSTNLPDGMYYEVTYDNLSQRYYIDAYKKWENVTIEANPREEPNAV